MNVQNRRKEKKMNKNLYLIIVLGVICPAVFFTASCSKKLLETKTAATSRPEISNASDTSGEKAERARRLEQDRLWQEATAHEAAVKEFVNENIHFAFDSALLSEKARRILKKKAGYLRVNPGLMVTVEGHCDERGTDAYNTALGDRRAQSVKRFLVDLGINAERLDTLSFGENRPVAMGQNEASWAKNRRAEFEIN
jgi:peptidoglycan-associated lipoprotein